MSDYRPADDDSNPPAPAWQRQPSSFDWDEWNSDPEASSSASTAPPRPFGASDGNPAGPAQPAVPAPSGDWAPPSAAPGQPAPNYPPPGQYPPGQYPAGPAGSSVPGYPPPGQYPPGPSVPGYPPPGQYQNAPYPAGPLPGSPYGVPENRPRDGFSIAALILGILPTIPLAVIFGIIGLVRTGDPRRRGRWMAVTGIVLAVCWLAVFIAVPLLVDAHSASRSATGQVTKAGTVSAKDLRVGDCFHHAINPGQHATARTMQLVPCSQPHNAQIFTSLTLADGPYLSGNGMVEKATAACGPKAVSYLGSKPKVDLLIGAYYPTSADWSRGERGAKCFLVDPDKDFTGDVRTDR